MLTQHYPEEGGVARAPTIPPGQTEDGVGGSYPIPKSHTQWASESNTSGAASTGSHLVPAVDSASARGKEKRENAGQ